MSKSKGEGKKIPEWSIFDRIDELENITLELMDKTEKAEPTLTKFVDSVTDAIVLASYGIWMTFILACEEASAPREGKNLILKQLKEQGLSEKSLQWLDGSLDNAAEAAETWKRKKGRT